MKGLRVSDLFNLTCPDFCPETRASRSSTRESRFVLRASAETGHLGTRNPATFEETRLRSTLGIFLQIKVSLVSSHRRPSSCNANGTITSNQALFLRGDFVSSHIKRATL